jgi:ATP-binding cassette, subfamily C, bacterial CydC
MILGRLTALLFRHPWRFIAAVLAASATVLAGVGLLTTSGYLISRAAERPPILDLMVLIVGCGSSGSRGRRFATSNG